MSNDPPSPDAAGDDQRTLLPEEAGGTWLEDERGAPGAREPFSHTERERYDLRGLLAVGGMGIVERVYDRRLGRLVVRKRARKVAQDIEQRLSREAWVVAQLKHPLIIQILDAGVLPSGHGYYTMPLIEGRPLSECLEQAQGPEERRLYIRTLRDTCEAVGFAHQEGFVHRDLKPDNIMVGSFGETHVMDWGLARPVPGPMGDRWRDSFPGEQVDLTGVGAVLGTPSYMSPEQAQGGSATPAGDVWSLGAILFEIVMGRRLFEGTSTRSILASVVVGAQPKLLASQPDLPGPLHAILSRALAMEPADRFPDAKSLADELTRWLEGRSVLSYRYTPTERVGSFVGRWKIAVGSVVAALALGMVGMGVFAFRARQESVSAVDARNRAQAAMEVAIAARKDADQHLQQALNAQISSALTLGDRVTGEVLAAESLQVGPDPVALGALMKWAGQPLPVSIQHIDEPYLQDVERFSGDGRWALTSVSDTVELWDVEQNQRLWSLPSFQMEAAYVANSGRTMLRGSGQTLVVERDGAKTSISKGQSGQVLIHPVTQEPYEYRPEFRSLASGRGSSSEGELLTECGHTVTFDGDGWWSGCSGGLVHFDGVKTTEYPAFRELRTDVPGVLRRHGDALFVGTLHSRVARIDTTTMELVWHRQFDQLDVKSIQTLADGKIVVVSFLDRSLSVLDADSGDLLFSLPRSRGIRWVGRDEKGQLLLLQADGLHRYSLDSSLRGRSMSVPSGVTDLAFSPDGHTLVVAAGKTIQQYDWPSRTLRSEREVQNVLKSLDYTADGSLVAAPSLPEPGLASSLLRNVGPGEWESYGDPPSRSSKRMAMLGDAAIVVTWSKVGPFYHAPGPDAPHWTIQDSSSAPSALVSTVDASVAVWSMADGLRVMKSGSGAVRSIPGIPQAYELAIDEEGALVLVLSTEETLLVELETGAVRWRHATTGLPPTAAAIDPSASVGAIGLIDGKLILRDLRDGSILATVRAHREKLDSLAFSRDGAALVSGGWDNAFRVWSTAPLKPSKEVLIQQIQDRWGTDLATVLEERQ